MKWVGNVAIMILATAGLAGNVQAQPSVPGNAILSGPDSLGDGHWYWIEVEPARGTTTGWVTTTGTATVRIAGSHFHADLKVDSQKVGADIILDGRIAGSRINAKESLLNTDATPETVRGIMRCAPIGEFLEERISLSGGQSGSASFLGLYRRVAH